MKLTISAMMLFVFGSLFGQSFLKLPIKETGPAKSYPMDGTPFLQRQYNLATEYNRTHSEWSQRTSLQKVATWGFGVGSKKAWWVYSIAGGSYYPDSSTCRKVGTHCYIFVEDSLWTNGRVTQAAVDSIENDFDNKTPANPAKGIYSTDVSAFGNPPDVDSDPSIVILILNIQDGYNGSGGYVAGFFDPSQESPDNTFPSVRSNLAEIYYVDANPTNLTTANGIEIAMSTAAHEFQHMINYNYHKTSSPPTFINEGCSMLAEINCGYPPSGLSLYANETNHYLFDWRGNDNTLVLNDYARAQRFHLYLWDRYGVGLFKYIVQSSLADPVAIMNDAFSKDSLSITFANVFTNWLIANELNDTTSNRLYGYAYPNLPASNGRAYYNPNVSSSDSVLPLGARYLLFKGGTNLSVTFQNPSASTKLAITAIETGSGAKNVVSVPIGSPFSEPGLGSTYSTVAFVVINNDIVGSPPNPLSYSYQASGTAATTTTELKWDNTEPVGYYPWKAANDTMVVTFDAYPGGTLDSIRVALRRAGSITGGIYQLATSGASPLGKLLARDTARITDSTTVPYPVPYQNWATVKLGAYNIKTDNPFGVAFFSGSVPTVPGVMITSIPGTSAFHSFTYLNGADATPNSPGWYFIGDGTNVSLYLIRAYVRFTTGVTQELSPVPVAFNLGQNYPNPFNPSTAITYQLPKSSQVTLSVYDILGRQVALLVNKRQAQGKYSVSFDASTLPSGVFFYRLTTDGNTAVKKMVVLK